MRNNFSPTRSVMLYGYSNTSWYYLQAIQTHYSSLDAVHGPHLEVEFERDRISLELPGSELSNGWTITPLAPPVVRVCSFSRFGTPEILWPFCFTWSQILKHQVDDYKPRRRIPCCQLLVKCMGCKRHVELEHKVHLQGAKKPFDYFTLTCTAEPEGIKNAESYVMWPFWPVCKTFQTIVG